MCLVIMMLDVNKKVSKNIRTSVFSELLANAKLPQPF